LESGKLIKADVVIKNGKIFTQSGLLNAGIVIEGEKIVEIAKDSLLPCAERVIDTSCKRSV
jgi:dihydroorotase-like cyclic amidohydrolase